MFFVFFLYDGVRICCAHKVLYLVYSHDYGYVYTIVFCAVPILFLRFKRVFAARKKNDTMREKHHILKGRVEGGEGCTRQRQ